MDACTCSLSLSLSLSLSVYLYLSPSLTHSPGKSCLLAYFVSPPMQVRMNMLRCNDIPHFHVQAGAYRHGGALEMSSGN